MRPYFVSSPLNYLSELQLVATRLLVSSDPASRLLKFRTRRSRQGCLHQQVSLESVGWTYKEGLNRKIACAIHLRFLHRPVCRGAFSGLVALHVASSPLGNLCGCARTKKVNLSGRRCSRIAAKGPFPQALLAGSYAPESIPAGIGNMQQKWSFASKLSALLMLITCYV